VHIDEVSEPQTNTVFHPRVSLGFLLVYIYIYIYIYIYMFDTLLHVISALVRVRNLLYIMIVYRNCSTDSFKHGNVE
jgi:hypothetical protein